MAYCVHTICIENGFKLHFSTTYTSSNIKIEACKHIWVVNSLSKLQYSHLFLIIFILTTIFAICAESWVIAVIYGRPLPFTATAILCPFSTFKSNHRDSEFVKLILVELLEYQVVGVCHSLSMIFNYQNLDLKSLEQAGVIPN